MKKMKKEREDKKAVHTITKHLVSLINFFEFSLCCFSVFGMVILRMKKNPRE
jgi:hypothetical protein